MECDRCASPLEQPGDYCLVCRTANTDQVVVEVSRERATITPIDEETPLGTITVSTTPEQGELQRQERRNFAGRIADAIHRKRPEAVYVAGDRNLIRAISAQSRYELLRVDQDQPVESVIDQLGEPALDVVNTDPSDKIGGSHTTLIGGRDGQQAIQTVAEHPHVKKIIPGPIDAGGTGSQSGLRAKVTRADDGGNVRLLLRDGSSVQENRIVTTASDIETGERVRADLNEALAAVGLQERPA